MNKYSAIAPTEARPQDDLAAQAFLHTSQAGAWVPLQQAGITGFLAGLLVMLLALKYRLMDWWFWALVVWLVVTIVVWSILQSHWFRLTTVKFENLTGLDLNGNGQVERLPPKAHNVHVNIQTEAAGGYEQRTQRANFPISEDDMATLARSLLAGRPFTEAEWCGKGKPFSKEQFRTMRSEMLKRGLIALVNDSAPQQGFKLTRSGRAVMEHFNGLGQPPSPTPPMDEP